MRTRLTRLYWSLAPALRQVYDWPGRLHAALYIALRLNRLYHRLGLSAQSQLRLMPAQLWISRRLMRQPYRVRVADIRWGGRPSGGERRVGSGLGRGLIFGGDWDIEDRRPVDDYLRSYVYSRTVFQMFEEGIPPTQTQQYLEMSAAVGRGDFADWRTRGCRSREDIDHHFEELQRIHESISKHGYASQAELGSSRWYDEIKVFVGRDGALHKLQGGGHHRLAMARIARVPTIAVLVIGVHRDWALQAQTAYGLDVLTSVDRCIRETMAVEAPSSAEQRNPELAREQTDEAPLGTIRSTGGEP